ncbi:MAG: exodeoxyribonuclease VII small subunit [Prevotella sp.]|nr:exodeoxyribonuclease VII small subunit [Prevotella sp.]
MMKKDIKYEEAVRRLEDIVDRMESGDMDIDTLGEQLKTAKELMKLCKDKLTKADEEVKKILDEK